MSMFEREFPDVKLRSGARPGQSFAGSELTKISRAWRIRMRRSRRLERVKQNKAQTLAATRPYMRRNMTWPLRWYFVVDAAALLISFLASWWFATYVNYLAYERPLYNAMSNDGLWRMGQYFLISCGVLLHFAHRGHYRMRMPYWQEARSILMTSGVALAADGFLQFANKHDFSRMSLILSWLLSALIMIEGHKLFRKVMRSRGQWHVATLLVGDGSAADDALAALKSEPGLGYAITAHVRDLPKAFEASGRSWENICAYYRVDYVLVALDGVELAQAEEPIAQLIRDDIPFSVAPPLRHMPVFGMTPQYFLNHDVMLLTHNRGLEQFLPRVIKRGFDVLAAGLALLLLSPVMLLVALLVKSDGGPVFFGHKRIGCNGEIFGCLKFRTMVTNSEEMLEKHLRENAEARAEWQAERKLRDDPRITWAGNFLRRSSLDELPQLLNVVFKGNLSLVGPRPHAVHAKAADRQYDEVVDGYFARHRVRPGITGWAQINGWRGETDTHEKIQQRVEHDLYYIENWSILFDLYILARTPLSLVKTKNAF